MLGIAMLIPSFIINPGPPPNPTVAQLITFGNQYHNSIVIGAWLQAVSPFLLILFAFAIVHLAGATTQLVGWMTMMAGTILVMVSLVEVEFYLSAVNGNPATTGLMSLDLLSSVQRLFSLVAAPALFLTPGIIILGSRVLPHVFGYLALALAGIFAALGIATLLSPIQSVVNILASVQGVWWLFAAITLCVRAEKASDTNLRSKSLLGWLVSMRRYVLREG
jgi:hypothetical protein